MPSPHKRSVRIAGHNTSVTLEAEFWAELSRLASERKISINRLVESVDVKRGGNLSSALRVYVLKDLQSSLRCAK